MDDHDCVVSAICIDQCVCHRVSFAELAQVAEQREARTFDALLACGRFGRTCTRCHPYVRAMLRDGTTVFDHLLVDDEPEAGDGVP